MKRLLDSDARSPLLRKAQRLIDAAPTDELSQERMLRIRRALDRPRRGASLRRVPALVLAGIALLFGASAFAAVRIFEALQPAAAPASERPAAHPAVRRARHVAAPSEAVAEPDAVEASSALPVPVPAPVPVPVRVPAPGVPEAEAAGEPATTPSALAESPHRVSHARARHATRARAGQRRTAHAPALAPVVAAPEAPAAAATEELEQRAVAYDSELVHRAVRALRRDRDPALAARLLEQQRAKSPQGPLAEEALSLQIEAAMALHSPRAEAFAREYLNRYPAGRYAAVARRALSDRPR